jgi:hypothetical protein
MTQEFDNPVLRQAAAFRREYVEKRPELLEYRPLFDAILERTANAEALDLKDTFPDWDERTVRRKVQSLREALETIAEDEELLYILTIEEGKPGHQTAELKRSRQTFLLRANLKLKDFYVRKWWSAAFPNTPGGQRRGMCLVYPTVEIKETHRVLASQGDLQLVKHLSRSLWMNGVECDDKEAAFFHDDPDEADRHLILTGNETSNHAIAQVTRPGKLAFRCGEKAISGNKRRWEDGEPETPRTVYALVTTCKCAWSEARLWIFEARHDRALEAVARYFADSRQVEALAKELNLSPTDEFPKELQLVFAINVNRQNQLRGADGEISLVHAEHETPRQPLEPPKQPVAKQTVGVVLPMKKRRA